MNEATANDVGTAAVGLSAGEKIKAARAQAGLHIVALAAALKVPVRKLEALEANRWEDLGDVTFIRALASSVSRHLKLDPAEVLACLPAGKHASLNIPSGLTGPLPSRPHSAMPQVSVGTAVRRGWPVVLLLAGAVAVYFSPQISTFVQGFGIGVGAAPVAQASTPAPVPVEVSVGTEPQLQQPMSAQTEAAAEPVAIPTAPVVDKLPLPPQNLAVSARPEQAAASVAVAPPAAPTPDAEILRVHTSRDTWVEVTDATGRLRIQRLVAAGEEIGFSGNPPYSVVVGKADSVHVTIRGQAYDLQPVSKNNVARFQAK
jgi:cytoskeleton protein RodZ